MTTVGTNYRQSLEALGLGGNHIGQSALAVPASTRCRRLRHLGEHVIAPYLPQNFSWHIVQRISRFLMLLTPWRDSSTTAPLFMSHFGIFKCDSEGG